MSTEISPATTAKKRSGKKPSHEPDDLPDSACAAAVDGGDAVVVDRTELIGVVVVGGAVVVVDAAGT